MKKYHLVSLGCPKNLIDSEIFAANLEHAGFEKADSANEADLILINTCGFIDAAKDESVTAILELLDLKQDNPEIKVIATGCLIKRYPSEIKKDIPEIDHIIDLKDFSSLTRLLNSTYVDDRSLLTPNYYAYLRISDGCSNNCSYCTIPAIRGKLKSRKPEDLLRETRKLVEKGVRELIITAQDTAAYGSDLDGNYNLIKLLADLHDVNQLEWIRLLYLHPAHLDPPIIKALAGLPRLLPYFDIPVQHIADRILREMNRKITAKQINFILDLIANKIPAAEFRTSLITGFPGETESEHDQLVEFIRERRFLRLGVFTYSREETTPASAMEKQIDPAVKRERMDEIMSVQQEISRQKLEGFIGRKLKVIIDRPSSDPDFSFVGRSVYDTPDIDGNVYINTDSRKIKTGDIVEVRIDDSWEYDLAGSITKSGG